MGHLDDVLQDIIAAVGVVELVGDFSELLAGFLLDVEMVEVEELNEDGDNGVFDVGFVVFVLLQVGGDFGDLIQEGFCYIFTVFDLRRLAFTIW